MPVDHVSPVERSQSPPDDAIRTPSAERAPRARPVEQTGEDRWEGEAGEQTDDKAPEKRSRKQKREAGKQSSRPQRRRFDREA